MGRPGYRHGERTPNGRLSEASMVDVPREVRQYCLGHHADELGVGYATYLALTEQGGRVSIGVLQRMQRKRQAAKQDRDPSLAERRDWAVEDKGDLGREGG